ncbi:MAG: ribosome-binding factor A [Bdellovibrionaceae bacterium]|jgi:ribosome-binding factor A|nr:ribosome-binding factor A [Pseudobdellovibrionaceae bacterium]
MPRGVRPLQVGRQVWQSLTRYFHEHPVYELQAEGFLTLTRVQMSGDLKTAKVFYRWSSWSSLAPERRIPEGSAELKLRTDPGSVPHQVVRETGEKTSTAYPELSSSQEKKINEVLKAYAPKLQSHLAKDLGLRFTPRLQFVFDRAYAEMLRVEETLRGLQTQGVVSVENEGIDGHDE